MKKKSNTEDFNLIDAESEEIDSQKKDFASEHKMKKVIIVTIIVVLFAIIAPFYNQIDSYVSDLICCESYGSSIWNECHNLKVFGSDYCKEHICAFDKCKNEIFRNFDYDYPYCKEHNCDIGLMPMYDAEDCYNFADGGGLFCAKHTCCDEDCDSFVHIKDDGYECLCCAAHMCMYKYDMNTEDLYKGFYCYSYRDGGGYYCSAHTCIKKDCTDEVYSGRYCRKHYFDENRY